MRLRALAVALAVLSSLHAEESAHARTQSIDALVQQLGSEDFDEREAAARKVMDLGDAAIPELKRLRETSENVEVKARLDLLIWPIYAEVAFSEIHRGSESEKIIELDGRPSFQRNNTKNVKLNWRQISGARVEIQMSERRNRDVAYVSPRSCPPGEYKFELVVTQGSKRSKPAIVTLTVDDAPKIALPETVDEKFAEGVISQEVLRRIIEEDGLQAKPVRDPNGPEE